MLLVCYNIAVWMDLPGTVCIKCGVCVSGFHSAQQLSGGWTEAAVTTNFCLTGCSVCCRRARGTAVCDSRDQWGLLTFSLTSTSFFDLGKAALFGQVPKGWRCDPGAHRFLPGPLWCHREMLLLTHSQWCHGEGGDGLSWAFGRSCSGGGELGPGSRTLIFMMAGEGQQHQQLPVLHLHHTLRWEQSHCLPFTALLYHSWFHSDPVSNDSIYQDFTEEGQRSLVFDDLL